jgi:hypothetical protein
MSEEFYRMKRLPPYVIAEVNAMRAAARAAGEDIIDLGMGNPDLPPPQHVIEKLVEVAQKPDAHGYSASKGIPGLAARRPIIMAAVSGVDVDPETEVVVTMGSKGRAGQPRHRDHRAGRCRAGTQSQLSDPHLWLHYCRGHDPLGADHPTKIISAHWIGRWPSPCRARRSWW